MIVDNGLCAQGFWSKNQRKITNLPYDSNLKAWNIRGRNKLASSPQRLGLNVISWRLAKVCETERASLDIQGQMQTKKLLWLDSFPFCVSDKARFAR